MTDAPRDEDAQKQLELMQKMIEDASRLLGNIHKEVKARQARQKANEKPEGEAPSDAS